MHFTKFYRWEAEMPDGIVISAGGDLRGAVRVSLIPADGLVLPRHDWVGLEFVSRFLRHFKRAAVGGFDKARYWAAIERDITPDRIAARQSRDAAGRKPVSQSIPVAKPTKGDEAVHCIETTTARYWVRSTTGGLLVTPKDYELWL